MEVSGTLTVAKSLKLKKALLENLRKESRLELVFGKVAEMDLSFIQILAAAVKSAEKGDRAISIKMPVPDILVENLKISGFLNHSNCVKASCVWCSIKEQGQGA